MARFTKVMTAVAVLSLAGVASAGIPWTNPNGSAVNYDWSNGMNDTGLFGSPSNFGDDNLYFLSSTFDAYADNGGTLDTATDTMNVDFAAHPTKKFVSIAVYEYGDYNITGGAGNSVSADLGMTGTVGGHPQSPFTDSFSFGASGASGGTIPWDDNAELLLAFAVPAVTNIHLEVSNTLVAMSDGAGGTASISGNFVLLGISVTVIPEPATLSLLALAGLVGLRRRR